MASVKKKKRVVIVVQLNDKEVSEIARTKKSNETLSSFVRAAIRSYARERWMRE